MALELMPMVKLQGREIRHPPRQRRVLMVAALLTQVGQAVRAVAVRVRLGKMAVVTGILLIHTLVTEVMAKNGPPVPGLITQVAVGASMSAIQP